MQAFGPGSSIKNYKARNGKQKFEFEEGPARRLQGDPTPETIVGSVIFFLRLDDDQKEKVYSELKERSDPTHEKYGQWYTDQQICDHFSPADHRVLSARSASSYSRHN